MNTDKLAVNWQNFARVSTSAQVCSYNTALCINQSYVLLS